MQKKLYNLILVVVSFLFALGTNFYFYSALRRSQIADQMLFGGWFGDNQRLVFYIFLALFFMLYLSLIYYLKNRLIRAVKRVIKKVISFPTNDIIAGTIGVVVGVLIAHLIGQLYSLIPIGFVSVTLAALTYILLAYIGGYVAIERISDYIPLKNKNLHQDVDLSKVISPKVLDTSAIIDGRFIEIAKTGFIEGDIYVPEFVLVELQHIADSDDELKRSKGRRGLDSLEELKKSTALQVVVITKDYQDIEEVDLKLLKLAKDMKASVVTNDYNLNKLAKVQGIKVLNVNDITNAVKSTAVAGEILEVDIIKEGKSSNQGVGYLEDGTMIVIEGGENFVGQKVETEVTSVLQTSAGRMIFAKIRS